MERLKLNLIDTFFDPAVAAASCQNANVLRDNEPFFLLSDKLTNCFHSFILFFLFSVSFVRLLA